MNFAVAGRFGLGLVLLVAGAELLVRGASRLALRFVNSPLVIGLTVVAFGTSSPEVAVSVQSGLAGQADIAVGNIVGSNVFNVLFILGLAALIAPLVVQKQPVRFDVPLALGVSVLLWIMALRSTRRSPQLRPGRAVSGAPALHGNGALPPLPRSCIPRARPGAR